MSKIFKIECPKCGEEFDAGSAFNSHIENAKKQQEAEIREAAEKKFKSQLELKNKEIDKTKKEAEKKAQQGRKKFKDQLQSKEQEIAKTKKEAEKKAQLEAEKKLKSKIEEKDKEIEKTKKDAEKKAQQDAEKLLKTKLEEKDKELKEAKKSAEKIAQEQVEKKFAIELAAKNEEIEKNKKAKEITEQRLTKRIEDLNKMVNQRNVELQGEIQEERLQDYLQKIFPEDDIDEVSKGAKGGDCIQTINYKDKSNIAQIYFESKEQNHSMRVLISY